MKKIKIKTPKTLILTLKICKRCANAWYSTVKRPKKCNQCQSTKWDTPRKYTRKK